MDNKFPAACAIISASYLSHGRVLASSYLNHHPGARFYLLVVDGSHADGDAGPGVRIIHLDELNLSYLRELCFKHTPTELCCVLKPTLMNLLLTKYNEEQVIYFDSDILVMRRLNKLIDLLPQADIVLTPHLLDPIPLDGLMPSEQDILIAGAHNLGFVAVRRSPSTQQFLQWWKNRLRDGGFIESSQGLLSDQRWVDLVPSLFPTVLLKDETYNVAYWNIHSRQITRDGGAFLVNGREPLTFFHFSGFDPAKPAIFSKHQNRTRIETSAGLMDLILLYLDLQLQNGFEICRTRQYKYGFFDNGIPICPAMRVTYSRLDQTQRAFFGNPFVTAENSFFEWATQPDVLSRSVSPFLKTLYDMRPDVAAEFPDLNGKHREAFLEWAANDGPLEHNYDPVAMRVLPPNEPSPDSNSADVSRAPKCSIIIPVFNNASLTAACLEIVLEKTRVDFDFETIVTNDASTDGTAALLDTYGKRIRVVAHETNAGFAAACNDAAAIAGGEHLIFLNNDTIPQPGWLEALVRYADAHPEAAVVGSKLLFPNGAVQHAGIVICEDREPRHIYSGLPAADPRVNRSRRYQAVTGACLLIRRTDFKGGAGFDLAFRNGYEDVDLCLRMGEAGRQVHYCHESVLIHLESASREASKKHDGWINSKMYRDRWGARVRPDEFDYYFEDELLKIDYRTLYPHKFSISPVLATVNSADRESDADHLIHTRASQVIGLLRDNIRLTISVRDAELRLRDVKGRAPEQSHADHTFESPRIISKGQNIWLSDRATNRVISIILPVKNGAFKLRKLLPTLRLQKARDLIEIIAIDSASTDESVQLLQEANATVIGIDPRTFNHGLTRNLATKYAQGAIYVFINQSTLPADENWLANLIRPFDFDSSLAGVCSRMLPRPDADWLNGKDIARNINASTERVVTKITDRQAYASLNPENLRKFVNFHSLSAAIRADVFKKIPFRDADFAEDLIWGKEALEAGFTIQFEPSSVALHSHNYAVLDIFRRNFDDGAACRKICGRTLDERDVAPAVMHEVREDWVYLKDECHLQGDELDHWKLLSVMRRTAQLLGHWIGVQYPSAGTDPAELVSMLSLTEQIKAGAKTEQPDELRTHARVAG